MIHSPLSEDAAQRFALSLSPRHLIALTLAAAVVWMADRIRRSGGAPPEPIALAAVLTNSGVWGRYHTWLVAQRHRPRTIEHYHLVLRDFFAHVAKTKILQPDGRRGPRQWHQATPRDLERWLDRRCRPQRRNAGRPLARNSRAAYSRRVLNFYRWASARRLLPGRNPFEDVRPVQWAPPVPRALPLSDITLLLERIEDRRIRTMVALGYYQMLRVGETVGLSVEDLRLNQHPPIMLVDGKGGREEWMAINPALVPLLREYLTTRPANGPLIENQRNPTRHLSGKYGARLLAAAMRQLVAETGHALRHTGATELLEATGDNVYVVQQALRHVSLQSTQIYLKHKPRQQYAHLARLPDPLALRRSAPVAVCPHCGGEVKPAS